MAVSGAVVAAAVVAVSGAFARNRHPDSCGKKKNACIIHKKGWLKKKKLKHQGWRRKNLESIKKTLTAFFLCTHILN